MTSDYFDQVSEAATFLGARLISNGAVLQPRLGIVLGSGLGAVADAIDNPLAISYSEIPHFPQSTVEGHSGRIVAGNLGGVPVIIMQGRGAFLRGLHAGAGYVPHARAGRAGTAGRGSDQRGAAASRRVIASGSWSRSPITSTSWAGIRSPVPTSRVLPAFLGRACASLT